MDRFAWFLICFFIVNAVLFCSADGLSRGFVRLHQAQLESANKSAEAMGFKNQFKAPRIRRVKSVLRLIGGTNAALSIVLLAARTLS